MKSTIYLRRGALLLAFAGPLLAGCESELDTFYNEVDGQFPTFVDNALGTSTKYATGEVVSFELRFAQQTAPIKEIRILQKIEPNRDSTLVQTIPYRAAFSRLRNADTLVVNYTVPAGQNKANVRVDAVVVSENTQVKTRSFNFRLAEPVPTITVDAPTNLTAPNNASRVPGDVVRFPVKLNTGGINTATSLTTAGTLYKDIDSLITYMRVGTGAERRVARQRVPVGTAAQTGAATTVNVDLTLPASSSGQEVVYRFEVKSRFQDKPTLPLPAGAPSTRSATATAAPITPTTTTALAAPRTATLTYTGTNGGDEAAYDLTTFALVPRTGADANKDVAITSTASNAVQLKALNSTKFFRYTTGGAAAYTNATLNSIRQTYQTAAAATQVAQLDNVVVGDVVIARLRNADQYAIFTVTGISRTATGVTLTMDIKAL
ncbi:hypothetical protein D3Y59_00885 [Hymenobacter oligotrophus]|uniref:Uncharacterized protein n=1 Tax=Hymenobacter oligotrophus TaxID=2319843 RepID=A0A3B7QWX5_9BACT|nr:hypothetical protein [Hymenobacter oligotrophus]AYA35733.1 hypothetical protein D3Y59_00885 [Hymenobacter oligotrophus]